VKSPAFPNLEGLDKLALRNGVDIRPTLVRVLTDLYIQKSTHTSEEERHYTELVLRLLESVDVATRKVVAEKLAGYATAPAAVVRRLARDLIEVAQPILERSPRLTGADLLAIVNERGLRHAAAIARRLPAEAKTAAAEKVDAAAETEPSLPPARPTAHGYQLAPVTSPLVGEVGLRALRASREGGMGSAESNKHPPPHPSAPRGEGAECGSLTGVRLGDLFLAASRAERRRILTNLEGPADEALPHWAAAQDAIRRLEAAALRRNPAEFARTLERALRISSEHAQRIVADEGGEPLLMAAKALGMTPEVLLRVLLFLNTAIGESVARVFDLVKLYDLLPRQAALRLVTSLRSATRTRRGASYLPVLAADEPARGLAGETARRAVAPQRQTANAEGAPITERHDRANAPRSGPRPR
jgi:hypothetical protein